MATPIPTLAKITRDGEVVTVRTKLTGLDPATVRARIVDGELIVTANTNTPTAPAKTTPDRHRLIDLGPKLRPVTTPSA